LIAFDFSTQKQLVDNSLSTIQSGLFGIERDFNSAIDLLSQPLDLGFDELDIPDDKPEPAAPDDVPSGAGGMQAILDVIGEAEAPGGYETQLGGGQIKGATKMTITEVAKRAGDRLDGKGNYAVGRYQFTTLRNQARAAGLDPDKDLFSAENQDKIALHLIKARGVTLDMIKNNPEEASVRLGAEWAGLPLLKVAGPYARKVGDSYYQGYGGNAATISVDRLRKAFSQAVASGGTPTPITPAKGSRVVDTVKISQGGNKTVSLTPNQGFGAYRTPTRSHAGIDIQTSGQRGWLVGFRGSGTVTFAGVGGDYGNLVIIKSGNTEYYFAHLARIMVKLGAYNGEVIGEIGTTGGSTGIHLHYEVRPNGRPIDPRPYLNLLDIGRETAAPQTAAAKTTTPAAQIASAKPAISSQEASQLAKERKGQTIFVPMPEAQIAQAPPATKSSGGGGIIGSVDTSGLNRYIEQRQYLSLA